MSPWQSYVLWTCETLGGQGSAVSNSHSSFYPNEVAFKFSSSSMHMDVDKGGDDTSRPKSNSIALGLVNGSTPTGFALFMVHVLLFYPTQIFYTRPATVL